jgi:hypothetical protein
MSVPPLHSFVASDRDLREAYRAALRLQHLAELAGATEEAAKARTIRRDIAGRLLELGRRHRTRR